MSYKNEYFIDYVNSSWKSEFMDYFLAFKSKMYYNKYRNGCICKIIQKANGPDSFST